MTNELIESPNLRASKVMGASVIGALGLSWVAVAGMLMSGQFAFNEFLDLVVLASAVGGVCGLIHAPFMCSLIRHEDLSQAFQFVYGTAVLFTFIAALFSGTLAIFVAFTAVSTLGIFAEGRFPIVAPTDICGQCGYSLYGLTEPGCPECGWERDSTA